MSDPIPGIEWDITQRCNYRCSYCPQGSCGDHCSGKVVEKVLCLMSEFESGWLVKLIGGEAMLHPRFFEICRRIAGKGHNLCMSTNFSLPLDYYRRMYDICRDKLKFISASLHLGHANPEKFIRKAVEFGSMTGGSVKLNIESVMTRENYNEVKRIGAMCREKGLQLKLQVKREGRQYVVYPREMEEYLSGRMMKNEANIRGRSFYGRMCYTGMYFFKIHVHGNVSRCYNPQPSGFDLGNIAEGTFERSREPKPCMSEVCTCTVPINRHMIVGIKSE